ncbi:glycosyl hydrolase [Phytohabitans sp. ZYX-F-186]|uniref:Glycosyl hydrolase n=1 Tax=Phytohabitans maris TaxID=3071409 RepID=A0ABU0ZPQ8_9ACTN|nr:glycosyl hydrolase [Phytohabitans sp. ZYX-F-186]MDQ7909031.1 glycosyl hydrolase [Phytohabitans sp. ZYX-F-186]
MRTSRRPRRVRHGALVAALALAVAAAPGAAQAGDREPSGGSILAQFRSPSAAAEPMSRSWWPDAGAGTSKAGLALTDQHLRAIAAGGFGGMEIAYLSDQVAAIPQSATLPPEQRLGQPGIDQNMAQTAAGQCCTDFSNAQAKTVGFGTEAWQKTLTQMYQTADSIKGGFVIDLTLSQHWPVAFNNIDPNDLGQHQNARTAYSVITTDDLAASGKSVPRPAQRLWDLDNVPFVFVDHYTAATIVKVASVAANGTPTFAYASLTDVSGKTSRTGAGTPAGIMDKAWVQANPGTFTGTLTAGSTTISGVNSLNGAQRQAGSILSGPGIPAGTQVVSVGTDSIVMSNAAAANASGAGVEARWNINTIDADWGPEPRNPRFTGKVDTEGNRRRMADRQYDYRTTIDRASLDALGCNVPAPGAALAAGDCVLFGTWHGGTGQTRSGGVNTVQYNREYATSIYDYAGTESTIDFWENNILGTWKDGAVVKRMGNTKLVNLIRDHAKTYPHASLFEDSLEFSKPTGTGNYWAPKVLSEMSSRLGYNASRYAPLLAGGSTFDTSVAGDQLASNRVTEDWTAQLTDDFATNHVAALQNWAKKTLGYNFRVQDIGGTGVQHAQIATGVHETSADSGSAENGRHVAGAASMTGSNWVSAESLTFTRDYTNPWVDVVKGLNLVWASGVNRPQWHGTPYKVTFNGAFSAWPGWEFQHGSPTGWGAFDPRQAYWSNVEGLTDYVARTQAVLQGGTGKADLAVLRGSNEISSPSRTAYSLQTLLDAGWNYHVIDDRMLALPTATVKNGRLNPNGAAYKAIVVNGVTQLNVPAVKKLTSLAKSGLPVVLYNSDIARVYGTNQPGNNDTELAAALATLKATANVRTITGGTQEQLDGTLRTAGLAPDASYAAPGLITLQRRDNKNDYYYLYNSRTATTVAAAAAAGTTGLRLTSTASERAGDRLVVGSGATQEVVTIASVASPDPGAPNPNVTLTAPLKYAHAAGEAVAKRIDAAVTLRGGGQPYVLDALTGDVTPVAHYTGGNGTVTVNVTLDSQEALIVRTGGGSSAVHATATSGGTVHYGDNGKDMFLRASTSGTYTVKLSNGRTRTAGADVPAAVDLSGGWRLSLESWGPKAGASDPTVPLKTTVTFPANALGAWSALPATAEQLTALDVTGMGQVSGIGRYTNTFQLPRDWDKRTDGANLVLGHGNGDQITAVTVNGHRITTIDQITNAVDIGPYLRAGANTIQVQVDSNLGNRVGRTAQSYGLTSVAFQPYTDAPLGGSSGNH